MYKLRNDSLPIAIALLPLIFLAFVWNQLPKEVPVHWNFHGEIDKYGGKGELLALMFLPVFMYIIFLVLPLVDPKGKIEQMGKKYNRIKFFVIAFISAITIYILNVAKNDAPTNQNMITLSMGVLFLILGNYSKTIKPNYFLGVRTPWTLKNEVVWKETHKLAGIIWFIGGLLIILSSLVFIQKINMLVFIILLIIMIALPTVYSFIVFKNRNNTID